MKILNGTLFEIKKWDMALYMVIFSPLIRVWIAVRGTKKYFNNP